MSARVMRFALSGSALVGAVAMAGGAAAHPPFTFAWAEGLPPATAMKAANAFVTESPPAGLPMAEAIRRAQRADAACSPARDGSADVDCRFSIVSEPEGGDLGEDVWVIRLTPGSGGALQSVALDRHRVGMRGDLPRGH